MNENKVPNCIGIIMDGNRRWAKNEGKLVFNGHRAGAEKLKEVLRWTKEVGVKHIIVYAFSTENWQRPAEEVSYLMDLLGEYLTKELDYFYNEGGILHCVGDTSKFSPHLQKVFRKAEEKTVNNSGTHLYFALNYGGRAEILSAVKKILSENPPLENVTEEYFAKHLQTGDMPDPDIIIRTSGEMRLSGFLPWQGVYSELFFTKTLWPDFSKEEFVKILEEYDSRERRLVK